MHYVTGGLCSVLFDGKRCSCQVFGGVLMRFLLGLGRRDRCVPRYGRWGTLMKCCESKIAGRRGEGGEFEEHGQIRRM